MTSIPLGPLALPAEPLLLILAAWLSISLARRLSGRDAARGEPPADATASDAASVLIQAVMIGLLAARVAFVSTHLEGHRAVPMAILDLRDGGWHAMAGLSTGLCWVVWRAWRLAAWRKALALGSAAGLAVWSIGQAVLVAWMPKGLPDVALPDLASGQTIRLRDLAAGRPVVVNLWATWCGPCRREMPVLAAAQARYQDVVFAFATRARQPKPPLDTSAAKGSP